MSLFEKPLDQITLDDLRGLIAAQVQEGQHVEFKIGLASENGLDGWHAGSDKIGRYAIEGLVKEIVAFANAQGGTLILGMEETKEAPPRASELKPIRAAAVLAERLKQRCRDNIEPALYGLDFVAIRVGEDGDGVIILRVAASPFAPHRSTSDLRCYYRRNDSSMPMTMDEIQRQTIAMSRRLETLEERFKSCRLNDLEFAARSITRGFEIRAAAFPMGPLLIPNIHRREVARPTIKEIVVQSGPTKYLANCLVRDNNWRPVLRGSACITVTDTGRNTLRIGADGHLFIQWARISERGPEEQRIPIGWFTGVLGNVLLSIERLRLAAKIPDIEYGVEVQLAVHGNPFSLMPYYNTYGFDDFGKFDPQLTVIGRYPVTSRHQFNEVTQLFEADVCHLAGQDNIEESTFDFAPHLKKIDRDFETSAMA